MAEIVRMPKLSDTMTEGVVAKWYKEVGDPVESGELLADIETDKATMEFESFQEGVLLYKGVDEGKGASVDSILAILGKKGEKIDSIIKDEKKQNKESGEQVDGSISLAKEEDVVKVVASREQAVEHKPTATNYNVGIDGRIKASPLAKKLAEEKGINLKSVSGSGDQGRIIKRDIEGFKGGGTFSADNMTESFQEIEISQMRKTIARRLSESKYAAPHFYLTISVDMTEVMNLRKKFFEIKEQKFSVNDIVIKATSMALKQHSGVNVSWLGDKIRYNKHVHIGVAIAVEEGLLVPVIKHANGKSIGQISEEVKHFAEKAKNKKLQPEDWEGNTFTISNLGMFGVEEFTAIINPPDACIMAVGTVQSIPVIKNNEVVAGDVMKITLSCDHRVVDGVSGSKFLQTVKTYLETPALIFM